MVSLGEQIQSLVTEKIASAGPVMQKTGEFFTEQIKTNTAEGHDFSGNIFAPYSTSYSRKTGKRGTPDFRLTGQMIDSIFTKAEDQYAKIGFRGDYERRGLSVATVMDYHQTGAGKNPMRRLMPESEEDTSPQMRRDIDKVAAFLAEWINQ